MEKKRKWLNALLLIAWGAFLTGCYPGGPEYTSDYNLVVTDYDQSFDFGSKLTYFMPDTVNFATNDEDIDEDVILGFERLILAEIESNMEARGYERVDSTFQEEPDLLIAVQVIAISNSGVSWIPGGGWWGGLYPPGWGWGWGGGWYYPPYYPIGYSYQTGTVLINLADPDDEIVEDGETKPALKWFAAMDGLLSSSTDANQQRIISGIEQAFDQSPYLQSNQ